MKRQKAFYPQQPNPPATLLSLTNPEDLRQEIQLVQLAIARRAYELFEAGTREHGHDWEDWFRAESELLRPVSVSIMELEDRIRVQANVLGFAENELKVSIESHCLTILGKKEVSATETEGGKLEYIDWHPDQILQCIDLAADVIPGSSMVRLQAGLLEFELPKVAGKKGVAATTAA